MKIIKHGKVEAWKLEVTCCFCKAVLVLDSPDDMYHKSTLIHSNFNKIDQINYYYKCPDCGTENEIDEYYIRHDVLKEIPKG